MTDVILDSGAYSVKTGKCKFPIDLDIYAEYLKREGHKYSEWFTFDVLDDGKASYENWRWLRKQGLDVIPVYHIYSDEKYLVKYLKQTDRVATGSMAKLPQKKRKHVLERVWKEYLLDKHGKPMYHIHGLGLSSMKVMFAFPWSSVDSASSLMMGSHGGLFLPLRLIEDGSGRLVPDVDHGWTIMSMSIRKGVRSRVGLQKGHNFFQLTAETQERYTKYLAQRNAQIGKPRPVDVESMPVKLFDMESPAEYLPPKGKIVLMSHWTHRVLWNMMFMHEWSTAINGPKIFSVTNEGIAEKMHEFGIDLPVLISFALGKGKINAFWKAIEGGTNGSAKGRALKRSK